MSNNRGRLQYLSHKYNRYFDGNNNFVVPDRLNYKNLEDDDFLEKTYMANLSFTLEEDTEIEELLLMIRPREAKLIRMTIDKHYRVLPKSCKFSSRLFLNDKTKFHFHGPSSDNTIFTDYGIVLGNHKFASYHSHPGFDYDFYDGYLRKSYYLDNKIPRCYINGNSVKDDVLTDNPMYYNEPDWECNAVDLWNYFKLAKCGKPPNIFPHCSTIAKNIENGIPHCFSFGQFAMLFPMLRNMKFATQSDEFHLLNPKKLHTYVHTAKLTCCFNCPLKYNVTLDFKHRTVFILVTGKHLDGCHEYQKRKGFLVMKDLLNLSSDHEMCKDIAKFGFDMSLLKYYGFDDIDLYYKPSLNKCHLLELGNGIKSDMNQLVKLLDTGTEYYSQFKSPIPLYLNDEMITHSFTVNGAKSFIMGTRTGLEKMAEQIFFNVDFINEFMLKELKLITIPFKDYKSKSLVVGCVALMHGQITAAFLKEFIIALKELLNKISDSAFVNLKYIVTKDSSIFYDAFKSQFPYIKVVRNIMPRAEQSFSKLDKVSKTTMAEAMIAFDPITCLAKVDALLLYHRLHYKDLMMTHRDKQLELSVSSGMSARQRVAETAANDKRLEKAQELDKVIKYIEAARKEYAFWTSSFKRVLPDINFSGSFEQLATEIKSNISKMTKIVNTGSELSVTQQELLKKLYNDAYSQMIEKQTSFDFDDSSESTGNTDVKNIIERFEAIYNDYSEIDIIKKNGFITFTNEVNSLIEFEFSSEEAINEKKPGDIIEVFYRLQKYLLHKVEQNISTMTLKLHKYPFVKRMTKLQELAFNRVMNLYTFKGTDYAVKLMKQDNLLINEDVCGCFKRTYNCIPCEHMLYEIHTKCEKKIRQNKSLAEGTKEYRDELQELFDTELSNKTSYEKFITRNIDVDLRVVLRARKMLRETILGEKRKEIEFYGVKIQLDIGEEFLDELNLIPIKHSGKGAVSIENLPIPLSAAQKLAQITWTLQEAMDKLDDDPREGEYLGCIDTPKNPMMM